MDRGDACRIGAQSGYARAVRPEIRAMTAADVAAVRALWGRVDGVGLSGADTPEGVARFLDRNPGLCWVAIDRDDLRVFSIEIPAR